jgi:carboxylate-amine ligase
MPYLIALSANSPFIAGRDSGLATVRPTLADALPRHGTGPALRDWRELESLVAWGRETGAVPDPSQHWWDCRLNLRTGTVEVRAPDAQPSLDDAEALISVVHALASDLADRHDAGESSIGPSSLAIDENRWRAARHGLDGELLDHHAGSAAPARAVIGALLDRIEPAADRLGGAPGLRCARTMLARDTPAELRSLARRGGMTAICEWMAERTEQTALGRDSGRAGPGIEPTWTSERRSPPTRTAR